MSFQISHARRAVLREPGSPSAQHALGQARLAAGHWELAAAAFAAAARLAPGAADHWCGLGKARLECGNPDGADFAFRRARVLAPHHPEATVGLASLLRGRGDSTSAEALILSALEAHPDNAPLRLARAQELVEDDQPDAALSLLGSEPPSTPLERSQWFVLRSTIAIQQNNPGLASSMADAVIPAPSGMLLPVVWRRVAAANAAGDEAVATEAAEAATALLDAPGEQLEPRIAAHFSLARFWAARGKADRAFALWSGGHRLLAKLQPFRKAEFAAFVEATVAGFDARRLHAGLRSGNDDPAPVFIVGMPRSGTTLTEQILAGHHAVHAAGERTALSASFARLGGAADTAAAVERLCLADQALLDEEAARYLQELHALAPGAARIVDKMPGNFRMLGLVGLLLPQARIIHCVRDPRDIGFSIYSRRFMGHHPYAHDLRDLGWYIAQHNRLMAHWTAVLPNPILRVHLHDWMADLKGTLARVLDFLGLDYDPNCERFFELDREVRTASRSQVRRPVNRAGLGRWRAYADQLMPMILELMAGGALGGAPSGSERLADNGTETGRWAQQPGWPLQAGIGQTLPTGAWAERMSFPVHQTPRSSA